MPRESASWDADAALEQLYAAHWRQLVRLSVLLVRDVATAEEVVQDAFVAVHGALVGAARPRQGARLPAAGGRQPLPLRPCGTARSSPGTPPARPARAPIPAPTRPRSRPTGADAVLDAMRELPDRQREVLALRYYLDLSEAEIADTLGISRGAVKSHASRGSATLRGPAQRLPGGAVMTGPDDQPRDDRLAELLSDAVSGRRAGPPARRHPQPNESDHHHELSTPLALRRRRCRRRHGRRDHRHRRRGWRPARCR